MNAAATRSSGTRGRVDRSIVVVVSLATIVRVLYAATAAHDPLLTLRAIDETSYADLARRFASGDHFFGRDTLWFAPLYPVALGLLMKGLGAAAIPAAIAIQHALGVAAAALALMTGRRLDAPHAGIIAGVILAALPTCVFAESRLLYTGPLVFATAAFLYVFAGAMRDPTARAAAWAGIVLGFAGLLRANVLAFVPVGACFLFLEASRSSAGSASRRRAATFALVFTIGAGVTLLPVLLRNGLVAGDWTPSTANAGMIFATAFAEDALGGRALQRTPEDFAPGGAFHREAEGAAGRPLPLGEAAEFHADRAWDRIRADPEWAIGLVAKKLLLLVNAREIDDNLGFELARERNAALRWLPVPWAIVLIPAGVGAFAAVAGRSRASRGFRPVALFAATIGATLLVYFVTSRYRLPLVVPGALLAGLGATCVVEWIRVRRAAFVGGAALVAAVLGAVSLRSPGVGEDEALRLVAIGAAFQERGDSVSALRVTDEALRRNPRIAGAWQNRALALDGLDRTREAEAAVSEAIRLDPELASAWMTRGAFLARAGRVQESIEPFRRAVTLAPEDPRALENLARALAATGQRLEAIEVGRAAVHAGAQDLEGELRAWEAEPEAAPARPLPVVPE